MTCSDLDSYQPEDFSPEEPAGFLPNVTDPAIRAWANSVRQLWMTLSRVVRPLTACVCLIDSAEFQPQGHLGPVHTQHIKLQLKLISKDLLTIFEIQ